VTLPPLNQVYFYLTEGCNLACRHCWLSPKLEGEELRYPFLAVDLLEKAIHEAKPLGLQGVKLTGGEPLLHPEFFRILEIIRREGLSLTIETNGVFCTPETAREIAKSPNRLVSVSLDGANAETHDGIRGKIGSFEAAGNAVRNLSAAGINPQIIFTIMKKNVDQIEAVIGLAESLGAASVKCNLVQPTARGEKLHESRESVGISQLINIGHAVEQQFSSKTQLNLYYDYPLAFRPLSSIANSQGCSICGIKGILGVIADGRYALCGVGQQVPELVFGRIGEDPLKKIWLENSVLKSLRAGLPAQLEGICSRCLMKGRCLGACLAQNYYSSGRLWSPFWFCRQAEEEGLFPASRLRSGDIDKGNSASHGG
jgi:SynChlorMet cassette radical SAM/SPASM protein ScmF